MNRTKDSIETQIDLNEHLRTKKRFDENSICCANCAFFDKFPIQKKDNNVLGACKANPPIPAPDYAESKLGIWPLVLGTFFCGIFQKKEE